MLWVHKRFKLPVVPGKYCALVEASVLDNLGKRYPGKPSRQKFDHCPHKANPPPEYSVQCTVYKCVATFFLNKHHLHSLLPLILGVVVHHTPDQHIWLRFWESHFGIGTGVLIPNFWPEIDVRSSTWWLGSLCGCPDPRHCCIHRRQLLQAQAGTLFPCTWFDFF